MNCAKFDPFSIMKARMVIVILHHHLQLSGFYYRIDSIKKQFTIFVFFKEATTVLMIYYFVPSRNPHTNTHKQGRKETNQINIF